MVTKKHFITTVIFITASFLLNTCDGSNTYNNLCWCEQEAHLEVGQTCKCGADKGACNCTEWVAYLDGIPIHKKGASWSDLDSAVDNIFKAYTWLEQDEMTVIKNKITEIQITPGNNWGESIIALIVVPEGIILEINGRSSRDYDIYMAFKYWVLSF